MEAKQSGLLRMAVQGWSSALGQWTVFGRRAESEPSKVLTDQLWEDPMEPVDLKDLVSFHIFL